MDVSIQVYVPNALPSDKPSTSIVE